jgi:hypothetical protein
MSKFHPTVELLEVREVLSHLTLPRHTVVPRPHHPPGHRPKPKHPHHGVTSPGGPGTTTGPAAPAAAVVSVPATTTPATPTPPAPFAVSVDSFGARGDGVTDDTAAINQALATGQDVSFTAGKTYLVSGTLEAQPNQAIYGNNATVKRASQVTTVTTTAIAAGTVNPVVTLTSAAGLLAGSSVGVTTGGSIRHVFVTNGGSGYTTAPTVTISGGGGSGATATATVSNGVVTGVTIVTGGKGYYAQPTFTFTGGGGAGAAAQANDLGETLEQTAHPILAVNGNQVTLGGTFATAMPSGAVMFTAGYTFDLNGNDRLSDLVLDGNRLSFSIARWQTTEEIRMLQGRNFVRNVTVWHSPGEGIVVYGFAEAVADSTIEDTSGNGIHLTLANHPRVSGCRVLNTNEDMSVQHADGAIVWSNAISDATIEDTVIGPTPLAGIGSIDSLDNSNFTLANNSIANAALAAIDINPGGPAGSPSGGVISGNRITSSGPLIVGPRPQSITGATQPPPNQIVISGNYFQTPTSALGLLDLTGAQYVTVTGNTFSDATASAYPAIQVAHSQHVDITGNQVLGTRYGIYLTTGADQQDVNVANNNISGTRGNAIRVETGQGPNLAVTGNTIATDATADSTVDAIFLGDSVNCANNTIDMTQGHSGIMVAGSNDFVQGNMVRGAETFGIQLAPTSTGDVVVNNATADPIDPNGSTGNVLSPNYTIA